MSSSISSSVTDSSNVNIDTFLKIYKELKPLTTAYKDAEGRSIQLWKTGQCSLIGAIFDKQGHLSIIPGERIRNPLNRKQIPSELVECLESLPIHRWDIIYDTHALALTIWPHLQAEGKKHYLFQVSEKLSMLEAGQRDAVKVEGLPDGRIRYYGEEKPARTPGLTRGSCHVTEYDVKKGIVRTWRECYDHSGKVNRIHPKGLHGRDIVRPHYPPTAKDLAAMAARKQDASLNNKSPTTLKKTAQQEKNGGSSSGGTSGRDTIESENSERVRKFIDGFAFFKGVGRRPSGPTLGQFRQLLQQTGLVRSYNAVHPHNSMPEKGMASGDIGGVACSTSYIKGLFEGPEALFEEDHFFVFPTLPNGNMPFTNAQLREVLRELAVGIYVHSTIPFFSLHFREDGSDLFPVIHPAYERTLVGRVISMLDYIMKGYLNGGVYKEEFIDNWHLNPDWETREGFADESLIDFRAYCQEYMNGADQSYISLSSLNQIIEEDPFIPEVLRSFGGFKNAFRIIAKQNSIQKEGNLFVIDGDFDVFYDINPPPEYKVALEEHVRKYGCQPSSYVQMEELYKLEAMRIHDHMVKMPLCRQYFALLSVINFFASYFSTLKAHRRVPSLSMIQSVLPKGSPPLFPHLPVILKRPEDLKCNMHVVLKDVLRIHEEALFGYFKGLFGHIVDEKEEDFNPLGKSHLTQLLKNQLEQHVLASCSAPVRRFFQSHAERLQLNELTAQLLDELIDAFKDHVVALKGRVIAFVIRSIRKNDKNLQKEVKNFFKGIAFRNEVKVIGTFSAPFIHLPHEIPSSILKKVERVVGGCGLYLHKQHVEPSLVGETFINCNMGLFLSTPAETLTVVQDNARNSRVLFRLFNENLPYYLADDYQWMEEVFLTRPGEEAARFDARLSIQDAMREGDKEGFLRLLESVPRLEELKDRQGRSLLHLAAGYQDLFYVEKLLAQGFSIEQKDAQGYLPIHYAAMVSSSSMALLLEQNTINAASDSGATPLIVAVQHQQVDAVLLLLDKGALLTFLVGGYTTLHNALHEGNLQIINAILSSPQVTDVINTCSKEGGTPLMLACELDRKDVVDRLIALGADSGVEVQNGCTAIEIAIHRECLPVLDSLLARTTPSGIALEAVAKNGSVAIVEKLLRYLYPYRNASGDNALHIALRSGNIQVALKMIEECVDVSFLNGINIEEDTPVKIAIALGLWKVIEALRSKGVEIDPRLLLAMEYNVILKQIFDAVQFSSDELQESALIAAQVGNFQALTFIFEPKGVDLNAIRGDGGWGLLHYLAKSDGIFLFRKYLARAMDLQQPLEQDGHKTLAAIAIEYGSERVLRAILTAMKERSVSLERAFQDKHLFYLAIENHLTEVLLEIFDPDSLVHTTLDNKNSLPAHVAARIGSVKVLQYLAMHEANLSGVDDDGWTALDYAVFAEANDAVAFLLERKVPVTVMSLFQAAKQVEDSNLKLLMGYNKSSATLDEAMIQAIRAHHFTAFNRLLLNNASLSYVTTDGWTPTLLASMTGQDKILQIILRYQLQDERSVLEKSPLQWAAEKKHTHCVILLLQAGHRNVLNMPAGTHATLENEQAAVSRNFLEALNNDDLVQMERVIRSVSINRMITVDMNAHRMLGTPLQLLIRLGRDLDVSRLIPMFLNEPSLDVNLQDDKGNTLAHILLENNLSPLTLRGVDLTIKNHEGQTPVHMAAISASKTLFDEVLTYLAAHEQLYVIEEVDVEGRTPIFYAINGFQEDNVDGLLRRGVNLRHLSRHLITPLAMACTKQALRIIQKLLTYGADPNQLVTIKRISPLHIALATKNYLTVWYLLSHGANSKVMDVNGNYLMHLAAGAGLDTIMRLFCAQGIPVGIKNHAGIDSKYLAAVNGHTNTLKMILSMQRRSPLHSSLIDEPIAIPQKDSESSSDILNEATLLHLACEAGHSETAAWLLDQGASPEIQSSNGYSALAYAAVSNASSALLSTLSQFNVSRKPEHLLNAILKAIYSDNLESVKALYKKGIPINAELTEGYTGLHIACKVGALQSTAWLLLNEADSTLLCQSRETALELAAANSSYEQFRLVVEHSQMDIDHTNQQGQTLLHIAARAGNLGHIMILIKRQAQLDIPDNQGRSPLHEAARAGHAEVVRMLLACGANFYSRDSMGKFPAELIKPSDDKTLGVITLFQSLFEERVDGQSLLHVAVRSNSSLAVLFLTQTLDVDSINARDARGCSALYEAVKANLKDIVKLLLFAGALIDITDSEGHTPLWFVCLHSPSPDMAQLLVGAGVNRELQRNVLEQVRKSNISCKLEIIKILEKHL